MYSRPVSLNAVDGSPTLEPSMHSPRNGSNRPRHSNGHRKPYYSSRFAIPAVCAVLGFLLVRPRRFPLSCCQSNIDAFDGVRTKPRMDPSSSA